MGRGKPPVAQTHTHMGISAQPITRQLWVWAQPIWDVRGLRRVLYSGMGLLCLRGRRPFLGVWTVCMKIPSYYRYIQHTVNYHG